MDFSLPAAHFPVALSELAWSVCGLFFCKDFLPQARYNPAAISDNTAIPPKAKTIFFCFLIYYPHFRSLIISKFVTFHDFTLLFFHFFPFILFHMVHSQTNEEDCAQLRMKTLAVTSVHILLLVRIQPPNTKQYLLTSFLLIPGKQ